MLTLKVISGPAAGESLGVEKEIVIGREGADLIIADPQISRRHTLVRPKDHGVEVEDLGSLNGTFVNGERLSSPVMLTSSGKITIGDSEIEVEVEITDAGLTQLAPAADAETAKGSVRRVEDEPAVTITPAAAAGAAAAAAAPPPPAAPAAPPRAERAPRRPPPVVPVDGGPPRRRGRWLVPLVLLLLAGAGTAIYFIATSDDEEAVTAYPLVASLRTADIVQGKTLIRFGGEVHQEPGGLGTVIGRLNLAKDITAASQVGKAVKVSSGSMIFRFDDGRIDATVTGTATRWADKTTDLNLTGKIIRGTREYDGAKGSFSLKSNQEVATVPTVGVGSFEGTIRY